MSCLPVRNSWTLAAVASATAITIIAIGIADVFGGRPVDSLKPEIRTAAFERIEQHAATAAALIEQWFTIRLPLQVGKASRVDVELLQRARQALDEALSG